MSVNIGTIEGLLKWRTDSSELDKSLDNAAKRANVSREQLSAYNKEINAVNNTYNKVAAAIDPAIAAEQKLQKAHTALSNALKLGLIDQAKHNDLLDKAHEKYTAAHSPLEALVSKVIGLTGALGPAGSAGKEMAEGLEKAVGGVGNLKESIASLGPLLPIIGSIAVALVGIGLVYEGVKLSIEFVSEAVSEGLKLQQVIERLNTSLRVTGSYSGLTSHEIVELADSYEMLTGRTKEEIIQSAIVLSRFKNLTEDSYPKALNATLAYAKAMGITADEAARKLGPALDGNSKSLAGLKEAGIVLTKGQKELLTQLVETGKVVEYQTLLFDILKEKIGEVGDNFDLNLIRQSQRAKNVLEEFKEGIASELIPALEDLVGTVVDSAGGWKMLQFVVSDMGHQIGDAIRTMVYGGVDLFLAWQEAGHKLDATLKSIFASIIESAGKVANALGVITLSPTLYAAGAQLKKTADDVRQSAVKDTIAAMDTMMTRAALNQKFMAHRQALEGNEDKGKPGSAQDDVDSKAAKQSKLNDKVTDYERILLDVGKAIREYSEHLAETTKRLVDQTFAQNHLLTAAGQSLLAYAQARQEQERTNAIETESAKLKKDHTAEIDKLTDAETKLRALHRDGDADKIHAQIVELNKVYEEDAKRIAAITGANFDLKVATDQRLKSTQADYDYTSKLSTLHAELTDVLTGTSVASREVATQLDIEKRQLDAVALAGTPLAASIALTTKREHERLDVLKDVIDAAKTLAGLDSQSQLQVAINHIDSNLSSSLRSVEEQYLQTIANIGHGSIEQGKKIIEENIKDFARWGSTLDEVLKSIHDNLQTIQDAQLASQVQGTAKTPYTIYKEERDNIVRIMTDSTSKVKISAEDGAAYLNKLTQDFVNNQLSSWGSLLNNLGNMFGGFLGRLFRQLSNAINSVQSAYQTGNQLGGMMSSMGMGGAASGAMGMIFAEFQIFYEIYKWGTKMLQDQANAKFHTVTTTEVIHGVETPPSYFDEAGRRASIALTDMIHSIIQTIGGVIDNLPQIAIRARKDGKEFSAYVAGVLVGVYKDAQTAMQEGLAYAIENASWAFIGVEMAQVLKASIGATFEELQANIEIGLQARRARIGEVGSSYLEIASKYDAEIAAARKLGLSVDDLIRSRDRELKATINSTLGIDSTVSDRLAALRSLNLGMGEAADGMAAQLRQLIDETQRQIEAMLARPGSLGGGAGNGMGGTGTGPIQGSGAPSDPEFSSHLPTKDNETEWDRQLAHLRQVLADYMEQLDKIPQALSDQQINMGIFDALYQYLQASPKYAAEAVKWAKVKVEIEFAQIKAQLILLGKWEEFSGMFTDAYNAAMAAAGKAGKGSHGGGNSDKQSAQSFLDDRRYQLQLAGMDQFHQQLAQINRDYDEQIKNAGKDVKLKAELVALQREEIANATKQHQKDVVAEFQSLVGPGDVFSDMHKKFDTVRKDIEGAGFGAERAGKMIDRLTAAEDAAVKKLSTQQFASMLGSLSSIIVDSDTNAQQHLLHNELLRAQEIVNFQIKMIEMREEYILLKAKGKLTQDELAILDKAFGWIDANASILPGGKDWVFDTGQAADALTDAANTQVDAANALKSAVESLLDYQTSLHTDSSMGLVDPRTALNNSRSDFAANEALALTGNVEAITKFKDIAERYRTNLLAFSPSSEMTASVLQGIDATINKIKLLPNVAAVLTPDATAIVTHLGYVATGVSNLAPITQAVNDNTAATYKTLTDTTPTAIAQASTASQADYMSATLASQKATTDKLQALREDIQIVAGNVLAWRSEARSRDTDEKLIQSAQLDELKIIAKKEKKPIAGVGG